MTHHTNADQQTENNDSIDAPVLRSLEELARGYLEARGKQNVVQLAVYRDGFEHGSLTITSHTLVDDVLPEIVTETDAITHHDHVYDFRFDEDPYGPSSLGRLTLYGADGIVDENEVHLEEGLAAADNHIQELLDDQEVYPIE